MSIVSRIRCGFWWDFSSPANSVRDSSRGGFCAARNPAWVASSTAEHRILNPAAAGSSPARPTSPAAYRVASSMAEGRTFNPVVRGSTPRRPTSYPSMSVGAVGSAPRSERGGRRFEPCTDSLLGGRQAARHQPLKLGSVGSNPTPRSDARMVEWKSRRAQAPVPFGACGFDSRSSYQGEWRNGRRARLRTLWAQARTGSTPVSPTMGKGDGMVDVLVLGTSAERRMGSSPIPCTRASVTERGRRLGLRGRGAQARGGSRPLART